MVTGSVILGNGEAGMMVQTLVVASQLVSLLLRMPKLMVSALVVVLASCIAALSVHSGSSPPSLCTMRTPVEHRPLPGRSSSLSFVELTLKVLAWAGLAVSSRHAAMNAATKKPNASALPFASRCSVFVAIIVSLLLSSRGEAAWLRPVRELPASCYRATTRRACVLGSYQFSTVGFRSRHSGDAREPQQVRHLEVLPQSRLPVWLLLEIGCGISFQYA